MCYHQGGMTYRHIEEDCGAEELEDEEQRHGKDFIETIKDVS